MPIKLGQVAFSFYVSSYVLQKKDAFVYFLRSGLRNAFSFIVLYATGILFLNFKFSFSPKISLPSSLTISLLQIGVFFLL